MSQGAAPTNGGHAVEPGRAADQYEQELIELAKTRSPEAWRTIYRNHYRPIYRYVRARVFDEMTAEDIASSVFVAALEGIGSYRYRGRPLLAWLYRLARNLVSDHQRKLLRNRNDDGGGSLRRSVSSLRRLVPKLGSEDDDDGMDSVPAEGHESDPAEMVQSLDLRHALNRLTKDQREVVALRFFAGLSTEEISRVVGKKPAAVYSLVARALVALREEIGKTDETSDESSPLPTIDIVEAEARASE